MAVLATPRAVAERAEAAPSLPPGDDERISGYGVMGLSFASGDYLVLRCMTAASFGSGYRAVWHRGPAGDLTVYSTAEPEHSCELHRRGLQPPLGTQQHRRRVARRAHAARPRR